MAVAASRVVQCLHVIHQKIQQTRKWRLKSLRGLVLHHRPVNVLLSLVERPEGEGVSSVLKRFEIEGLRTLRAYCRSERNSAQLEAGL